jgi:hypothetical protein
VRRMTDQPRFPSPALAPSHPSPPAGESNTGTVGMHMALIPGTDKARPRRGQARRLCELPGGRGRTRRPPPCARLPTRQRLSGCDPAGAAACAPACRPPPAPLSSPPLPRPRAGHSLEPPPACGQALPPWDEPQRPGRGVERLRHVHGHIHGALRDGGEAGVERSGPGPVRSRAGERRFAGRAAGSNGVGVAAAPRRGWGGGRRSCGAGVATATGWLAHARAHEGCCLRHTAHTHRPPRNSLGRNPSLPSLLRSISPQVAPMRPAPFCTGQAHTWDGTIVAAGARSEGDANGSMLSTPGTRPWETRVLGLCARVRL